MIDTHCVAKDLSRHSTHECGPDTNFLSSFQYSVKHLVLSLSITRLSLPTNLSTIRLLHPMDLLSITQILHLVHLSLSCISTLPGPPIGGYLQHLTHKWVLSKLGFSCWPSTGDFSSSLLHFFGSSTSILSSPSFLALLFHGDLSTKGGDFLLVSPPISAPDPLLNSL